MALIILNIAYANNRCFDVWFSLWVATVGLNSSCLLLNCVKQVIRGGMEPFVVAKMFSVAYIAAAVWDQMHNRITGSLRLRLDLRGAQSDL